MRPRRRPVPPAPGSHPLPIGEHPPIRGPRTLIARPAVRRAARLAPVPLVVALGACAPDPTTAPSPGLLAGELRVDLFMPDQRLLLGERVGQLQITELRAGFGAELPPPIACPPPGCAPPSPPALPPLVRIPAREPVPWARWTALGAAPDTLRVVIAPVGAGGAAVAMPPRAALTIAGTIPVLAPGVPAFQPGPFVVHLPWAATLALPVPPLPDFPRRGARLRLVLDPVSWLADSAASRTRLALPPFLERDLGPDDPPVAALLARARSAIRLEPY